MIRIGSAVCNDFHSGLELENGDLLLSGSITDSSSLVNPGHVNNVWIVRTDPQGCIAGNPCDDYIVVTPVEHLPDLADHRFYLLPNVGSDVVQIHHSGTGRPGTWHLSIISPFGQCMEQVSVSSFPATVEVGNLQAGMYYLLVENGKGERAVLEMFKR